MKSKDHTFDYRIYFNNKKYAHTTIDEAKSIVNVPEHE